MSDNWKRVEFALIVKVIISFKHIDEYCWRGLKREWIVIVRIVGEESAEDGMSESLGWRLKLRWAG